MKKTWLLYLLVFSWVTSFAQTGRLRDSVYWNSPYYQIWYSETLENPLSVYYGVPCPTGTASRAGMDFYTESNIHTSDNNDYVGNEWDKGHMAPAADFNCDRTMLYETFSYVNSSLQQQSLNRGVWKKLETRERELAIQYPEIKVFIRVEFDKVPPRVPGGAAIPKGYYKELKYGTTRECYYFLNKKPDNSDLSNFKCPCRNAID